MSTFEHSISSLPHPNPPQISMPDQDTTSPSLDTLIGYFVESKKAITKVESIALANAFIDRSRGDLLEISTLVNRSVVQLAQLQEIHYEAHRAWQAAREVNDTCRAEFEVCITETFPIVQWLRGVYGVHMGSVPFGKFMFAKANKDIVSHLDDLHARVRAEIQQLERVPSMVELAHDANPKLVLTDFINLDGINEIDRDFWETIDLTNESMGHLGDICDEFHAELRFAAENIDKANAFYHGKSFAIAAEEFSKMEDMAYTVSSDVSALVRHYDLCLTALKNIEGGGEAVANAGLDMDQMQTTAPVEAPQTRDDLDHMLQVLKGDASQIDEVCAEIAECFTEIEKKSHSVHAIRTEFERQHLAQRMVAQNMKRLQPSIANWLARGSLGHARWVELEQRFNDRAKDLRSVGSFYREYLVAFHHMLAEMKRRALRRKVFEDMVKTARYELHHAYDVEVKERQSFANEFGRHLPSDLWEMLGGEDLPSEFDVTVVKAEEGKAAETPAEVWQEAYKKLSNLRREQR